MPNPDDSFSALSEEIESYKEKCINHYFPVDPIHTPDVFRLDVRTFVVLAHASFEEYYERLGVFLASEIEDGFRLRKKFTRASGMLLSLYGSKIAFSDVNKEPEVTIFDRIRISLEAAAKAMSGFCVERNHGAGPKYLRKILIPVGIDFYPEPDAKDALIKLSEKRGEYAHKGSIGTPTTPEEALEFVDFCLVYAKDVRDKANEILSELL